MNGTTLAVLTALILTSGCAARDLKPALAAQRLSDDAALGVDNEVRVVAEADAWEGPTKISTQLTPFRVTIENKSEKPVRVQLANMELSGPEGRTFRALPPLRVTGTAPLAELPPNWAPRALPFASTGFGAASYYAPLYGDGVMTYPGRFPYDPSYYGSYAAWPRRALPTPEMILRALPEGVLEPGGRVEGFVYFQRVPRGIDPVAFTARFTEGDAEGEVAERVAFVRIPFTSRK